MAVSLCPLLVEIVALGAYAVELAYVGYQGAWLAGRVAWIGGAFWGLLWASLVGVLCLANSAHGRRLPIILGKSEGSKLQPLATIARTVRGE